MVVIRSFITLILVLLVPCLSANSDTRAFHFTYDSEHNLVSIHSKDSSLKGILGSFAIHTGVETYLHPDADRLINFSVNKLPLKQAIKNLCIPLNCIIRYHTEKQSSQPMIIGLDVLPTGNEQSEMLEAVVPISTELAMHARIHQSSKIHQLIRKRFEIRLKKLPADQQQEVLAQYEQKIRHYKERAERRDKVKLKMTQHRENRIKQKNDRLKAMQESDPAAYEIHLQRQQQAELLYGPTGHQQ